VVCWGNRGEDGVLFKLGKRGPLVAAIEKLGPATQLSGAGGQNCALHSEGLISCWGDGSSRAILVAKPRRPVEKLVVGPNGVCSLLDDRRLQCFRTPFEDSPSSTSLLPDAATLQGVTALALGHWHACVVLGKGEVQCWGNNGDGEVAPDNATRWMPPTRMDGLPPATSVAVAKRHSCALLADDRVMCWGSPHDGESRGTLRELPMRARTLGMMYETSCALTVEGILQCWGDKGFGAASSHAHRPTDPPWAVPF
jgi:hypothetical protein